MKKAITIGGTEYKMPGMSIDAYMEYLELCEKMDGKARYARQDIEAMMLFVCKAYGGQFTAEELKNPDTGLSVAELILEFQLIEANVASEMSKRMEKIEKNFQTGK